MHLHLIEDNTGDVVDHIEFCSDYCNRDHTGEDYQLWNGCNESEFDTSCANCGAAIAGACGPYI